MWLEDCLPIAYQALTANDWDQVVQLEHETMAQPFPASRMQRMWTSTSLYGWRVLRIRDGDARGQLLAYCCYLRQRDEAEVLRLGCWPYMGGRRLGSWLMLNLLHELRAAHHRRVHLEVRRSNQVARRLYRRLGFEEVGCRRHYYPDREDALLLALAIPPEGGDARQFTRLRGQIRETLTQHWGDPPGHDRFPPVP